MHQGDTGAGEMANVLGEAVDRREKLLTALKQLQPVDAQHLADWLGVPEAGASAVLKELAQVGVAVREGRLWSVRGTSAREAEPPAAVEDGTRRRIVRPAPAAAAVEVPAPAPRAPRPGGRDIIENNRHLLGTMSDPKLATQLGVPRAALTQARLHAGIPSFRSTGGMRGVARSEVSAQPVAPVSAPPTRAGSERGDVRDKILASRDLLGTRADKSVAEELGVSRASVVQMRQKLGIPSWQPRGPSRPAPAPRAVPAVAPAPVPRPEPAARAEASPVRASSEAITGWLWSATARDGEESITLQIAAVDLPGAARAALGAMRGRVESIVMVGPMLIAR